MKSSIGISIQCRETQSKYLCFLDQHWKFYWFAYFFKNVKKIPQIIAQIKFSFLKKKCRKGLYVNFSPTVGWFFRGDPNNIWFLYVQILYRLIGLIIFELFYNFPGKIRLQIVKISNQEVLAELRFKGKTFYHFQTEHFLTAAVSNSSIFLNSNWNSLYHFTLQK